MKTIEVAEKLKSFIRTHCIGLTHDEEMEIACFIIDWFDLDWEDIYEECHQ